MSGRLADKVAIITGASRGLGRYCALGYAAEGASVVIAARSRGNGEKSLDCTAAMIEEAGGSALPLTCDVADPTSVETMIAAVLERFGRIDILMANAGYYAPGALSTMSREDWMRQFDVNVHGVFHCIRSALPTMIEQGHGNIITISSVAAIKGSHYGATKRAVLGMTMGFAEEQKANGIAVNAMRPVAAVKTPGWLESRPTDVLQKRMHRVSPPDSYVEAAVLLAMQNGESITGQEFTDAEIVKRLGSLKQLDRFSAMNSEIWAASLGNDLTAEGELP
jgi:NAD(P)-dependent dehydrogenase (short-subunit alcohol dehydrogenase family)